ncbi:MAG TPA: alginate lyase family protein [Sphingobacteriaceae bacterium]
MAATVHWYLNRLKTISSKELVFRLGQFYRSRSEKRELHKYKTPAFFEINCKHLLFIDEPEEVKTDPRADIFGTVFHPETIRDWHRDASSGKRFPLSYSKAINMRNDQYGSAKHVWELNRMLFLPQLALSYRKDNNPQTLMLIIRLLRLWIGQNPYLAGINWYSNIEVNIRLINWALTWDILKMEELAAADPEISDFVSREWIPSIYSHCVYSFKNPSLHSSANNHLISEYAGLFIAGCKWAFPESDTWTAYCKKGLEREIDLQHSENGINREETAKYIPFITDFLLLAMVFGARSGNPLSSGYNLRFYQILRYVHELLDMGGSVPVYGDEDDGRVIALNPGKEVNAYYSLLGSGAIWFKDPTLLRDKSIDQKNRLLFGAGGAAVYQECGSELPLKKSSAFPKEGHFIFRLQHSCNDEIYFHFDAAPLGYLSIAAHGHADALSFVLHIDGFPVITDPGTYCYHTHPEWRSYFLSTKAHNTICINDQNQATFVGPTLWLDHYKTTVSDFGNSDNYDFAVAEHDGYRQFNTRHRRKVEFLKDQQRFIISDHIYNDGGRPMKIEMPFHFHPAVPYTFHGDSIELESPSKRIVRISLDPQLNWRMLKGETSPILGWYSGSFYKKEPAPVCLGTAGSSPTLHFSTIIDIC